MNNSPVAKELARQHSRKPIASGQVLDDHRYTPSSGVLGCSLNTGWLTNSMGFLACIACRGGVVAAFSEKASGRASIPHRRS